MKLPLKAIASLALLGSLGGCNEAPMATAVPVAEVPAAGPVFTIRVDEALGTQPQDGRLLLLLSNTDRDEPRFLVDNSLDTQLIYGRNVSDWAPGTDMLIDAAHIGFPINTLAELPPGRYFVQALLNRYQDFTLSNGKTVSLPPDQGEGQQWNRKPGNYLSEPVALDITADGEYEIVLDQQIPAIEPAEDTEFIKHVRMKSELLSEFWGEDVYLGAHILLPKDFEAHPEARYPLMVFHGHFPSDFGAFRPEPPDPDLEPVYSERFSMDGYNIIQQQEAHNNYLRWIADDFPRFLAIEIQHPTPYYDDSYAVNSESQGPYGDAINYELIPFIEEQFRGIGEGWARFTYGGSTGGWEAMATQMFYPDEFNGAFVACPDPIDFRAYLTMNIYDDENGYFYPSDFQSILRPGRRDYLGNVSSSIKDQNDLERVLGDRNRSGQQFDIWEATFSPMADDGYPADLWDPETGVIDPEVAAYWKENFDLSYILKRDWETLGPKLEGKLHIYTGDMDNYYLNNAVYLVEEFLESTTEPYYGGEVDYGDRAEHCWNGDQENGNHLSRLRYNWMYVPKILKRIEESAPEGADVSSWRY
ncbi:hypothetical protein [Congregibacter sp.]|uniref:hypothetical protein n=1 Tax=Congregibacter sp. TaxID=2744308 RepID=UPI003F6D0479